MHKAEGIYSAIGLPTIIRARSVGRSIGGEVLTNLA
jgi:hypothetical protein